MQVYPVDRVDRAWLSERLCEAMLEALYKQGVLKEAERQTLCAVLCRATAESPKRSSNEDHR